MLAEKAGCELVLLDMAFILTANNFCEPVF